MGRFEYYPLLYLPSQEPPGTAEQTTKSSETAPHSGAGGGANKGGGGGGVLHLQGHVSLQYIQY